ncbi:MAG: DUF2156 domain-containing protein [Lachnospiraceae bacterium]|nr:DUF2156 domain-containing protein [Lachnospiraceae bacterium]
MNEDYRLTPKRRIIENIAIAGLIVLSACAVIAAVFHFAGMEIFMYGPLEINHTIQILLAIVMIVISWRVYLRHRWAWAASLVILIAGIVLDFMAIQHPLHIVLLVAEAVAFVVLLVCHQDFCRSASRGSVRTLTAEEKDRVRKLVCKYGQNAGSYLTLEDDKSIYFGQTVEGVIPYGIVGDVIVVNGDPICAPEDFEKLLTEFHGFCNKNIYSCVFLSITDAFLPIYKEMGYGTVKCGEEPRFDVQGYSLKGGKAAKVRAEYNHAVKSGVTVAEYAPTKHQDPAVEAEFSRITDEWLDGKKSGELVFTLGNVGFDAPMDKRYFYALDQEGKMVGFVVYVPFGGMTGYMADVTRRSKDAPRGVMELIHVTAIEKFKEEGIAWMSMGLAPLAHMDEGEDKDSLTNKLLAYVYEHLNGFYGFKDLFRAKEKYNPTMWVPGYFAFDPKVITPDIAYAVVAIQNPRGAIDYLKGFFHNHRKMPELNQEQKKELQRKHEALAQQQNNQAE